MKVMSYRSIAITTGADYDRLIKWMNKGYPFRDALLKAMNVCRYRSWSAKEVNMVVELRDNGFSFKEIEEKVGISHDKCRARYHHVKRYLRGRR